MNNNNIELIKFVHLDTLDIDYDKTTIVIDSFSDLITIDLFLNIKDRVCPFCKSHHINIKDWSIKNLYHPVLVDKFIVLRWHKPKLKCMECGCTRTVTSNIAAEANITFIGMFYLIGKFRNPRNTFSDVSRMYHIPLSNVIKCFDEHVKLNRHHLTRIVCFDEIYSRKLTTTKYSLTLFDPVSNTILDMIDSRRKNVLEEYFSSIPTLERLKVEYACIDMWETYSNIISRCLPNAIIAVDSFHIIEHLTNAMNKIRIRIQKSFAGSKDNDKQGYYWLLKCFHYYFVEDFEKIKYTWRANSRFSYLVDKYQVLEKLLYINKELEDAYYLLTEYREFNLSGDYDEAKTKIPDFISKFKNSKSKEFVDFGFTLANWKDGIINSFIKVNGKRLSNGPIESCNSRTKLILHNGHGYSSFERFRNRVMFGLNFNEPITIIDTKNTSAETDVN